jgi:hypothetical protein
MVLTVRIFYLQLRLSEAFFVTRLPKVFTLGIFYFLRSLRAALFVMRLPMVLTVGIFLRVYNFFGGLLFAGIDYITNARLVKTK